MTRSPTCRSRRSKSKPPASIAAYRRGGLQRIHYHAGVLRRGRPGAGHTGDARQIVRAGQTLLNVTVRIIRLPARLISKPKTPTRSPTKTTSAVDLLAHKAIAERDVQQAESDRSQAQSDVESSTDALRALGISDPEATAKEPPAPSKSLCARPWRVKLSSGWWGRDNFCRPARRSVSPSPTPARFGFWSTCIRAIWAACASVTRSISPPMLTRTAFRDGFPTSRRAGSHHAHSASADRHRKPRAQAQERHVRHRDGPRGGHCECAAGARRRGAARQGEYALRVRADRVESICPPSGNRGRLSGGRTQIPAASTKASAWWATAASSSSSKIPCNIRPLPLDSRLDS